MNHSPYIEYDRSKQDYVKSNRANMNDVERKIWYLFLNKRPLWYKFLRQKPLWPFIVDFYCSKLMLVIEIDWSSHDWRDVEDANRTDYLNNLRIIVIRYRNNQITYSFNEICKDISQTMKYRKVFLDFQEKLENIP